MVCGYDWVVIDGDALNHPYGLAVYGSFIFWSEFLDSEIRRIRVGENGLIGRSRIVYSDKSSLFELHVYDPSLQTQTTACSNSNGGCEHFCFASACKGSLGCEPVRCLCADGFSVDPGDRKKCIGQLDTVNGLIDTNLTITETNNAF
uniref:Uncharacterized protein n=1 Tax=Parascaris equorum TaxID=6256 RepID=A0A914RGV7_PAREQ